MWNSPSNPGFSVLSSLRRASVSLSTKMENGCPQAGIEQDVCEGLSTGSSAGKGKRWCVCVLGTGQGGHVGCVYSAISELNELNVLEGHSCGPGRALGLRLDHYLDLYFVGIWKISGLVAAVVPTEARSQGQAGSLRPQSRHPT